MQGFTEDLLQAVNGAELVEVHKDYPDGDWAAMYVWHGGVTVNVYSLTDAGTCEATDVFTYMDTPDRETVLSGIARHWREMIAEIEEANES